MTTYQTMEIMEGIHEIYTFCIIPWKSLRRRQSFFLDVGICESDNSIGAIHF